MDKLQEIYFETHTEWRTWLEKNHDSATGVYLIFYKVESKMPSMRWEEAVKVALCFGWIDSTVKKLDHERRRQYFCSRNAKSVWSKLNKTYIKELIENDLMHNSGLEKVKIAKENGYWSALDDVDNLIVPQDLQIAFNKNSTAFNNYKNFAPSYRKGYLYWLNQAKRKQTREKRIEKIIDCCQKNIKSRANWS